MELASQDAELRPRCSASSTSCPACRSLDDLARHLTGFLGEVDEPPPPIAVAMRMGDSRAGRAALGAAAAAGVKHMAHRFIVGETPEGRARRAARACGSDGVATLGRPARRGDRHRRPRPTATPRAATRRSRRSPRAARDWPARPALERDGAGALPRVNLSVKVSALTPLLRPDAPERGKRDAADRAARPAAPRARARRAPAHRHGVASTRARRSPSSCSSCSPSPSSATARRPASSCRPTCATRREHARRGSLDWAARRTPRAHPLDDPARQGRLLGPRDRRGRASTAGRRRCSRSRPTRDRNFEPLTRRLLDARAGASASRSPRTTCARSPTRSPTTARSAATARDLELQILRGLGDDAPARARRAPAARAHLLPGRRPRRRHGLPRAPPAREHDQRLLPRRPGARRRRSPSCSRAP